MNEDLRQRSAEEERLLGRDPERDEADRQTLQDEAEFERAYLKGLMQSAFFRRWLMNKLNWLGAFTTPISVTPAGFPDDKATYFALGQHAAGWQLWTEFDDLCPDLASVMRREGGQAILGANVAEAQ